MIRKKNNQRSEARQQMRGGSGEVRLRHQLEQKDLTARCRLCAELTVPPGSSIGLHEHAGEDEIFIVQSGTGIITENGTDSEITAGDTIVTGNGASHSVKNTGTADLIITAIILQY